MVGCACAVRVFTLADDFPAAAVTSFEHETVEAERVTFVGAVNNSANRFWLSPLENETSTGLFCFIQLLPPSFVWKITPNSPTIQPLVELINSTPLKVKSPDRDEAIQERPPSSV